MWVDYSQGESLPSHLENIGSESADQRVDKFDELLERWQKRITVKNLVLAERYFKAEIELGIIFDVFPGFPKVRTEFVAIFQRDFRFGRGATQHSRGRVMLRPRLSNIPLKTPHILRHRDRDNCGVLIENVQSVQSVDGVIGSSVWLQFANLVYGNRAGAVNSGDGAGIEIRFIPTYWERCIVRGRSATVDDKLDSKEIKSGTEIVDAISYNSAPFDRDGSALREAVNFVSRIGLCVGNDIEGLLGLEGFNGHIEVSKVFFGPIDLYANAA